MHSVTYMFNLGFTVKPDIYPPASWNTLLWERANHIRRVKSGSFLLSPLELERSTAHKTTRTVRRQTPSLNSPSTTFTPDITARMVTSYKCTMYDVC